ncbi:MAG: 30S ribosomal protein S9 [Candidatus Omnitrophota bacterium]
MENDKVINGATGRRKEAVARVQITPGTGVATINKRPINEYFKTDTLRTIAMQAFGVTKTTGKFDVTATVSGGGPSGQAGAVRLGTARALVANDENLRKLLRSFGFLTRDPRAKERKKYGQKRARKKFQYTKR